jgi:uncharacterized protein YndB with AHSA1/START domain
MTTVPTGHVRTTPAGRELVLRRTFQAPAADVWASTTESERLGRWFGTWTGEPGAGSTVLVQMTAEGDVPPEPVHILECDPPARLVVDVPQPAGPPWHLAVDLAEDGGTTTLTFTQRLDEGIDVADVGPGWEYYLDRLVASRAGDPMPDFDGYLAALGAHYRSLA